VIAPNNFFISVSETLNDVRDETFGFGTNRKMRMIIFETKTTAKALVARPSTRIVCRAIEVAFELLFPAAGEFLIKHGRASTRKQHRPAQALVS
jgi:hypothetical protein